MRGAVGHYTIGRIACDLIVDPKIALLIEVNQFRISFGRHGIPAQSEKVKASGYVPLANVSDDVWKKPTTLWAAGFTATTRHITRTWTSQMPMIRPC